MKIYCAKKFLELVPIFKTPRHIFYTDMLLVDGVSRRYGKHECVVRTDGFQMHRNVAFIPSFKRRFAFQLCIYVAVGFQKKNSLNDVVLFLLRSLYVLVAVSNGMYDECIA